MSARWIKSFINAKNLVSEAYRKQFKKVIRMMHSFELSK